MSGPSLPFLSAFQVGVHEQPADRQVPRHRQSTFSIHEVTDETFLDIYAAQASIAPVDSLSCPAEEPSLNRLFRSSSPRESALSATPTLSVHSRPRIAMPSSSLAQGTLSTSEKLEMLNNSRKLPASAMTLCTLVAAALTACGGGIAESGAASEVTVASASGSEPVTDAEALRVRADGTNTRTVSKEGGSFSVTGTQNVRYGAGFRWVQKNVVGSGSCTNGFFGSDPAVGSQKTCELIVAAATPAKAPTTAPAPTEAAMTPAPAPASTTIVAATPAAAPAVITANATSPAAQPTVTSLMPAINVASLVARTPGSSTVDIVNTAEIAPNGDGAFRTVCGPSHMAFDDPIVFPGKAGQSHLHTFFGNTGTTAGSTPESIRSTGNSTCRGGVANRSSYWVPTMIDTKDGSAIAAESIGVYYKNGELDGSLINLLPEGLRMIAGNPGATAPRGPADGFSYRFKCIGSTDSENNKHGDEIQNCSAGAQLWQEIFFPQCWDGVNLDSPDHKSHMSYLVQDQSPPFAKHCPSTHPVVLPGITFNVVYVVKEQDAPLRWRLASDNYASSVPGGYSSHGDWFNGWKKEVSDAFVNNCIRAKKDCHSHLLGDGRTIF